MFTPQGMLSAGRNRRQGPACAPCFEAGSVIVRMRGWAASQGSWPGAWAWQKCDPSQCPQDLGTQSLCQGGMRQCHTPVYPRPGEAGGLPHRWPLVAPAVLLWFPEQRLPCITGKLVCIRMLGDASVLAFADLVQRQLWAHWCSSRSGW